MRGGEGFKGAALSKNARKEDCRCRLQTSGKLPFLLVSFENGSKYELSYYVYRNLYESNILFHISHHYIVDSIYQYMRLTSKL